MEYFEIFDLPPKLNLDLARLQERFHELSRMYHPDYHTRASVDEQERALRMTALLNDAYRTLRDATRRVDYLVASHGFEIDGSKVPQALLAEVFEINEELEQLRTSRGAGRPDADVVQSLEKFRELIAGKLQAYKAELDAAAAKWDGLVDSNADEDARRQQLSKLANIVAQSAYLRNLEREIESEVSA